MSMLRKLPERGLPGGYPLSIETDHLRHDTYAA